MSTAPVDVLMVGTGEYTTGFVNGKASDSDKGAGVVALTLVDQRQQGNVGRLGMCGTNGEKFPQIREHMQRCIGDAYPNSGYDLSFDNFPNGPERDPTAYIKALDTFKKGDACIIFTPDDTHFSIALEAIRRGMHVLIAKPMVKTLEQHLTLAGMAKKHNVLVMCEVHKRFDPLYTDARDRIQLLGNFSYINAYMSQPKKQLETFKAWAGKSSDISYYLNAHHIDFHEWCVNGQARPVSVVATAATGVAKSLGIDTEDTICLTVQWANRDGTLGIATYTASWIAPPSDVHSQQRFFYMSARGEVRIDQAHRGYTTSTDAAGFASCNPLFMKYTPADGKFAGQNGYGYRGISEFVLAANALNRGEKELADFDRALATVNVTIGTTAIMEAGRRSLDNGGARIEIAYPEGDFSCHPIGFVGDVEAATQAAAI